MLNKKSVRELALGTQLGELYGAIEVIEKASSKIRKNKQSQYTLMLQGLHKRKEQADQVLNQLKQAYGGQWDTLYEEAKAAKETLKHDLLTVADRVQSIL